MSWRKFYWWVGILLTLPMAYLFMDRFDFVRLSKTSMSTVESVWGHNDRCGGKHSYACTKYSARLQYQIENITYQIEVSAGEERHNNQPVSKARHHVNDQVQIAYDPRHPERAYRDTFWDIWGAPVWTLIGQICALIASLFERNSTRNDD